MTNLDVANMARKDEFIAAYEEAKVAKGEKQAINSASIRIDEQITKFEKTSFSRKEEKALYEDAISV